MRKIKLKKKRGGVKHSHLFNSQTKQMKTNKTVNPDIKAERSILTSDICPYRYT